MSKILQKLDTVGVLLLVGAALRYAITNVWDKWAIGLALLGGVCVVAGLIANYKQIMATLGKRSTKYFSNYVVSVTLVLALVGGLNFLGQRHSKRFDLTGSGRFTLAPQTRQILSKLDRDIDVKAFFPGGDYVPLKELLTEYRGLSHHIRAEFVDPDKNPEVAKQYGVTSGYGTYVNPFTGTSLKFGTVVMLMGGKSEKIEKRQEEVKEEDLTNAIIKLGRTESKTVYFVQGHGEKDLSDSERGGFSMAKEGLEKEGYKVLPLNLASEAKVPQDAKVAVIAGPKTEPFAKEFDFLNEFLNRGGGVLVMVDPQAASLADFLKGWQVVPDNDVILDVSGAGRLMNTGPSVPLVFQYEPHAITNRFKGQMTFFPLARSIQAGKESVAGVTVTTLFKSHENSWGETNLKSQDATFDEKADLKGPLPMAVAVTKEIKASTDTSPAVDARMVVVGNSDFAAVPYFGSQGNGNLFLNMVGWLAQDEDLISIRPKAPEDRKVIMSQSQQKMVQLLTLAVIPGAVLVVGIAVFMRRRR